MTNYYVVYLRPPHSTDSQCIPSAHLLTGRPHFHIICPPAHRPPTLPCHLASLLGSCGIVRYNIPAASSRLLSSKLLGDLLSSFKIPGGMRCDGRLYSTLPHFAPRAVYFPKRKNDSYKNVTLKDFVPE